MTYPISQWPTPERHQLTLERRRFAKQFAISDAIRVDQHQQIIDHERITFDVELFSSGTREHDIALPEFFVPTDWWQAFKERWFPRWALKRWPVQRKCLGGGRAAVEVTSLFPELHTPAIQNRMRIEYFVGEPVFTGGAR